MSNKLIKVLALATQSGKQGLEVYEYACDIVELVNDVDLSREFNEHFPGLINEDLYC